MGQVFEEIACQNHVETLFPKSLFQGKSLDVTHDDPRAIRLKARSHGRVLLHRNDPAPPLAENARHSPGGWAQLQYGFARSNQPQSQRTRIVRVIKIQW